MKREEIEDMLSGLNTYGAEINSVIVAAMFSYYQSLERVISKTLAVHLCVETVDIYEISIANRINVEPCKNGVLYKCDGEEFVFIEKPFLRNGNGTIEWAIDYKVPVKGSVH